MLKEMKNRKLWRPSCCFIQAFLIYAWLTNLLTTESYFSVYALCAAAGLFSLFGNYRKTESISPRARITLAVLSFGFSVCVALANYRIYESQAMVIMILNGLCGILGGYALAYHVMLFCLNHLPLTDDETSRTSGGEKKVFTWVFFITLLINGVFFAFEGCPGILTQDSKSTVTQIIYGQYNNTMPFYHTLTVELFFNIGFMLFGTTTAAVATFSCVQIVFMSFCFAYTVTTLYSAGANKVFLIAVSAFYALMPYHIVYSATLWKDIPFSAATLLIAVSSFRILRNLSNNKRYDYIVFALSCIAFSLWRTNGWYSLLAACIIAVPLLRKQYKKLLSILCVVIVVCWILINLVLSILHIPGTDMVEAMSLPLQQIGRVVANGRDISDADMQLLSQAFLVEEIPEEYDPLCSNPMKFEMLRRENMKFIRDNIMDYVKLWLRLGFQYPSEYLKAWVELTKGYWNSGYDYWTYTRGVIENDLGVVQTAGDNIISELILLIFFCINTPAFLKPLQSIGLFVWIAFACFGISFIRKKEECFIALPTIVIILGLWLATPVYAEFRFAYPVFLVVPVLLGSIMFAPKQDESSAEA